MNLRIEEPIVINNHSLFEKKIKKALGIGIEENIVVTIIVNNDCINHPEILKDISDTVIESFKKYYEENNFDPSNGNYIPDRLEYEPTDSGITLTFYKQK
jgi:hypothetical protein